MSRTNYDEFARAIEDATEAYAGPVRLAQDGEQAARRAVTGSDYRLVQPVSGSFPVSPQPGQVVCRTDQSGDPLYRYDADLPGWVLIGAGGGGTAWDFDEGDASTVYSIGTLDLEGGDA